MMTNLIVAYQLTHTEHDYSDFMKSIDSLGVAINVFESSLYFVSSRINAKDAFGVLKPLILLKDRLLVVDAKRNDAGWINLNNADLVKVLWNQ